MNEQTLMLASLRWHQLRLAACVPQPIMGCSRSFRGFQGFALGPFLLQSQAGLYWTGTNGCRREAGPATRQPYNRAARARAFRLAPTPEPGYGCCCFARVHVGSPAATARTELPPLPPSFPPLGSSVRGSGAGSARKAEGSRALSGRLGSRGTPRALLPERLRPRRWWPPGGVWPGDVAAERGRSWRLGHSLGGVAFPRSLPFGWSGPPSGSGHRLVFVTRPRASGTGPRVRSKGTGRLWGAVTYENITGVTDHKVLAALGGEAESRLAESAVDTLGSAGKGSGKSSPRRTVLAHDSSGGEGWGILMEFESACSPGPRISLLLPEVGVACVALHAALFPLKRINVLWSPGLCLQPTQSGSVPG